MLCEKLNIHCFWSLRFGSRFEEREKLNFNAGPTKLQLIHLGAVANIVHQDVYHCAEITILCTLPILATRKHALSSSRPLRHILTMLRAADYLMTLLPTVNHQPLPEEESGWRISMFNKLPPHTQKKEKKSSFHLLGKYLDQKLNLISLSHNILTGFLIMCGSSEVIRP